MKNKKWLVGGVVAGAFASVAAMYKATSEFAKDMLYRNEIDRTDLDVLDVEEMQLKNEEGMVLYGYLIKHNHADKTLIMLHEIKENASSLIECAQHFEKMLPETNIVLLDSESHGMSDGYLRSFGEKDAKNSILWNRFLLKKLGSQQHFILYGKNLGANAILRASATHELQNVSAIVSDGACDNVSHYLTDLLFKKYKINSKFAAPILRRVIKQETGIDAESLKFSAKNLAALIKLVDSKEINGGVAKEVFEKAVFSDDLDPVKYVADNNMSTKADSGQLLEVVKKAIEANPKAVEDVKNNTIPTIFIHSKNEKNVNFNRVFDLYNNNASDASLFPIKENHFYEMNQDESYSNLLKDFLAKHI